ncbi:hypothetical protein SLE2022_147160 [Rubroshorea leprosula]
MEQILLEILTKEATKGNKPSNTYKQQSLARVAETVSLKFGVECVPAHVENQLKTIKFTWNIITTLQNKSGFGWDDTLKMITADREVADQQVTIHYLYRPYRFPL